MNHVELCIKSTETVETAMQQLNKTGKKILFVLEKDFLIGTLMDSDLRRHLLNGGGLTDFVIAAAHREPKTAKNRKEGLDLLQKHSGPFGLPAIPIVDHKGRLQDIVLSITQPFQEKTDLHLPTVIMAGGKGTRLDPYTRVLPKPLIPVGELPIIEHIMQRFAYYSCSPFHIIVNYKKQLIKAYFSENERHYDIKWYDEDRPLGTGGGLYLLKNHIRKTFFFTNCDVLLRSDYADILKFHRTNKNIVTMIGVCKNLTIPYGVVDVGKDGVVASMREKPELSFLTNAGVYIVEPEILEDIQENQEISFPDLIEIQRKKGRKIAVYPVSEHEWLDMGQLSELENMRKQLSEE